MIELLQAQALAWRSDERPHKGGEQSSDGRRSPSHYPILTFTQRGYFDSGPYGAVDAATGRNSP